MFIYVDKYVHNMILRLFVLYDYVQCCEDTVGVELRYIINLSLLLLLLLLLLIYYSLVSFFVSVC